MVPTNSQYEYKLIAALLHDVQRTHGLVFNTRACRLTIQKIEKRLSAEGIGFLTKTLPRLGKAFDKALAGNTPLNATSIGYQPMENSKLPRFLGEFISRVLQTDGTLLRSPCVLSVSVVRQVCYLFYKYELPYSEDQEQAVIQKFKETENDLSTVQAELEEIQAYLDATTTVRRSRRETTPPKVKVVMEARKLLWELFRFFDPKDIYPKHGPGAVATKQQLWGKYYWTNVSAKITEHYPFDEYFCSSLGEVCDMNSTWSRISEESLPARVILVPKDSRGPRLISCEPVDYQWIQQGLGRAIVELVESHELTKFNVHFTDQRPNQIGAILGSLNGKYATLDLAEASDRISLALVRLLFPGNVLTYLEACRTSSTVLPDGSELPLKKFAPMGSCLCFPILALSCWAILTASAPDADTRESILVYGDDVIVPTAQAANAIEQLESFGLKVNRDKSCTSGLFRESCGTDAFQGIEVTPVRLRTVWSSTPRPDVYSSWIAYANSLLSKQYVCAYEYIVGRLLSVYGSIPDKETLGSRAPSLQYLPIDAKPVRRRYNKNLQKFEYNVLTIKSPSITKKMNGWSMLLRYFTEGRRASMSSSDGIRREKGLSDIYRESEPFSVSEYTERRTSMLVRRWR